MFKFTFSLSNNPNPFTTQAEERERIQQAVAPQTITRKLPAPPKRPLPPPSASEENVPRTRKRGWVPTTSSASEPLSQPTLTNGWIDTPAKYMAQASESHQNGGGDDLDSDLPPAKRRKTLTDSILSTAFSAALIGTAVGMTAYRLWRDRGKPATESGSDHVEQPPPPYQKDGWVEMTSVDPRNALANRTPRLPKKPRSNTRRATRTRRTPITISPSRSPGRVASPFSPPQPEEFRDDQGELEDQMDWMGDKIRHLIEQGQKALGKEIVVMNDEPINEDEGAVDDGMEGWEEENPGFHSAGPSSIASSSFTQPQRRPRPLSINTSGSPSTSPDLAFPASYDSTPTSPRVKRSRTAAGGSHTRTPSGSGSPYFGASSASKLGGRTSLNPEDIKVIYEHGGLSSNSHGRVHGFEDEDSRLLTEGMDAVRKAYKIH